MSIAINVENLSKAYQIGQFGTGALTRDISRWWALARGKEDPFLKIGETNDRAKKGKSDIVWSLRDINFEIEQGQAIGIIGKNGAGKSTLLKILSQVTAPTTGKINMMGRVASLLEVGTGFHPELTGRENIYLNGAILGMRKAEITRKFDEIVDFSGVERYIDTPVKRYSSGMYVRLAFAVAAHLESEILIVDEVLAVGDAAFQKKCLGKMGDISQSDGRTILFVSHNLSSVKKLCSKSLLINKGEIEMFDTSSNVINKYNSSENSQDSNVFLNDKIVLNKKGKRGITLHSVSLVDYGEKSNYQINQESPLKFEIKISNEGGEDVETRIGVFLINEDQICITSAISDINLDAGYINLNEGDNTIRLLFKNHHLMPGRYNLRIWIKSALHERLIDFTTDSVFIEVNNSLLANYPELSMGSIYLPFQYSKVEN